MKCSLRLCDIVDAVLRYYSDKYPNKIVNPRQLSCFVVKQVGDKYYYYPVNSIIKRDEIRYRLDGPDYYEHMADFNIDLYSYCQDPSGIQTSVTGSGILRFEERNCKVYEPNWYCPQIARHIYPIWRNSETYKAIAHLVSEGIILFAIAER